MNLKTLLATSLACLSIGSVDAQRRPEPTLSKSEKANATKLEKFAHKLLVDRPTDAAIDKMTENEVPKIWQRQLDDESKGTFRVMSQSRGNNVTLRIMWTTDDNPDDYTVHLLDNGKVVAHFSENNGKTIISNGRDPIPYYKLETSIDKDGKVVLTASHKNGYFESVVVDGKNSKILSGLEYSKAILKVYRFEKWRKEAIERERRNL